MATFYQQLNTKPPAKDENASLIFPSDSSDTILRMLQIILK